MKKLINDPANVVREELQGIEAAHGDLVKVFYDPYYITRTDSPIQGQGRAVVRRWVGTRADARRIRRQRHARRRVSR